jgi:hypothetical protein
MPVPLPATGPNVPGCLGGQAGDEGDAIGGSVEHVGAEQITRPSRVPAPAAVDQGRGGDGRPAWERQLAFGADQGSLGDHLVAVAEELSLELCGIGAKGACDGPVFAWVARLGLEERHRQE